MTKRARPGVAGLAGHLDLEQATGLAQCGFVHEVAMAAAAGGQPEPPRIIQLAPRGEVTARDGRPFSFDPEALVAGFNAGGVKLPIDFEHESDFPALLGAKPARGWIERLEARPEGVFAEVEWNDDAVAALKARHYRYISPTVFLAPDRKTARLFKGAALVAAPALGMPALASLSPHDPTEGAPMLKDVLALLGLTENATLDEAKAAVGRLSAVDPAQYAPVAQLSAAQTELAQLRAEKRDREAAEAEARCASLVDGAVEAGKIAPAARDQYLGLARLSFDQTKAAIEAMPAVIAPGEGDKTRRQPAGEAGALTDDERTVIARLGLTDEQYLKQRAA